ncbi:toll/interleukin-1 receptor domain-containing protein [Desulfuromonas acetoxidans]|uniref:toll/interleukin-1 receptor domain-containing protein n=1 Tax=Desulfuromonas acetoxidans TaxID=891 RepID=UPI002930E400|nr:toll/interleukin-1 receptor domain-containing protein [Desulfuromonas acetoxidans]
MAKIFFSYCHADESLRDELEKHLTILKRQGHIETWHDRRIVAGENIDQEIDQNLNTSEIILLLVSADFLASDYCYDVEMKRAMERHDAGQAKVIPVILRPCSWHDALFGKLLATPTDGKAVTKFATLDEGFLEVTEAIKTALKQLGLSKAPEEQKPFAPASSAPSFQPMTQEGPRSSNLRIKKEFTDRERDSFLSESYEFIARYFENSLVELEKRNQNIETGFRRIDANHFMATVYLNGQQKCGCKIWVDGSHSFSGGIAYSDMHGLAAYMGDTINERLSVTSDGYNLLLQPLGMISVLSPQEKTQLTAEGAAEYLWSHFIASLQR